jgi:hypothetical protein
MEKQSEVRGDADQAARSRSGRIRNSGDAARAFRQLNRWPRERFQMIGVDAKGRPIAFYDSSPARSPRRACIRAKSGARSIRPRA